MKRTPIKRGGPLQRRSQPARKPMKRSPRKRADSVERIHMGRLAEMGCLVCRRSAEIHHVTSDGYGRITRTHKRTVPLCPDHHRNCPTAVHVIGQAMFNQVHGVDLVGWADEAWFKTLELELQNA